MRRIVSVLIGSAALVAALGSPASADDKFLGLVPVKADNASVLNNVLNQANILQNPTVKLLSRD
ncbi:hypothetical protein AB0O75_14875 [Streptomyces sp. NPDC088921]|uniref:hypothetical protein n=1 Tax=unclassified Streptomyces TaxID=2593676 RepID=UPI00341B8178